jgi:hypothetical protein
MRKRAFDHRLPIHQVVSSATVVLPSKSPSVRLMKLMHDPHVGCVEIGPSADLLLMTASSNLLAQVRAVLGEDFKTIALHDQRGTGSAVEPASQWGAPIASSTAWHYAIPQPAPVLQTADVDPEVAAVAQAAGAEARRACDVALASFHRLALDLQLLREREVLVSMTRDAEIARLEQALGLLEDEQAHQQQRCASLHDDLRRLATRKIDILAEHLKTVQAAVPSAPDDASESSAPSLRSRAYLGAGTSGGAVIGGGGSGGPRTSSPASARTAERGFPASSKGVGNSGNGVSGGAVAAETSFSAKPNAETNLSTLRGVSPSRRAWAKVRQRLVQSSLRPTGAGAALAGPTYACGPLSRATADSYFAAYGAGGARPPRYL